YFMRVEIKILGAAQDFDFDAHEIDGQVAPVDFWETDGVLLRGDDGLRLAFFAAVDDDQHLLLAEAVMVGKTFGINEIAAERNEAALKAFRLGNAAEGGDFFFF